MALNGLNSGSKKVALKGLKRGQTLDFWLSFAAILVLCVKFDLA